MIATLEYIKNKFKEYNDQMFEGKLQPLPFKLSTVEKSLAFAPENVFILTP